MSQSHLHVSHSLKATLRSFEKEAFLRKIFEEVTDEEGRRPASAFKGPSDLCGERVKVLNLSMTW